MLTILNAAPEGWGAFNQHRCFILQGSGWECSKCQECALTWYDGLDDMAENKGVLGSNPPCLGRKSRKIFSLVSGWVL